MFEANPWEVANVHVRRTRLRALLTLDGRPMATVSRNAGLHSEAIRHIVSGYRPNPTLDTMGRILCELRIPVASGGVRCGRWSDLD
jgi:hypothetical protein